MFRIWAIIILACLLNACATPEPVPVTHNVCLPLKEYSLTEQVQAADELSHMPDSAEIPKMITDYAVLRAADRACLGK